MNILVTGGAGFIGTTLCEMLLQNENVSSVICLDNLTYASNKRYLTLLNDPKFKFQKCDISSFNDCKSYIELYDVDHIIHVAAETHVDRSIDNPENFIITNIVGTYNLLESFRDYSNKSGKTNNTFLHVSTDEVFGSLSYSDLPFNETTPYSPRSPYSASKAASDHLARSYFHTYGMNVIVTNCSNNYGAYQHPEKFIPTLIKNMLEDKDIPIYGNGMNIRDWIYVEDHCNGLISALFHGVAGETYLFGGGNEVTNQHMVSLMRSVLTSKKILSKSKIKTVEDRPGHDLRYAINYSKANKELGWTPKYNLMDGLSRTLDWYMANYNLLEMYDAKRLGLKSK